MSKKEQENHKRRDGAARLIAQFSQPLTSVDSGSKLTFLTPMLTFIAADVKMQAGDFVCYGG